MEALAEKLIQPIVKISALPTMPTNLQHTFEIVVWEQRWTYIRNCISAWVKKKKGIVIVASSEDCLPAYSQITKVNNAPDMWYLHSSLLQVDLLGHRSCASMAKAS